MSFTREEHELFRNQVAKHFGDLSDQGFSIAETERADEIVGEQLVFDLKRKDTNRGLRIKLLRSPDQAKVALTVFVEKGGTGGFMLDNYLRLKGSVSDHAIRQLSLSERAGSLEQRLDDVLGHVRRAIDTHLLVVLSGGDWPVVPINWGDYR
jgi:hypothetical protein